MLSGKNEPKGELSIYSQTYDLIYLSEDVQKDIPQSYDLLLHPVSLFYVVVL